ncbi:MAG: HD domain-containing protein, partial [Candidatus Margulisiibacteriota bacterium]|nr:HD domain-containing protein [Candidatus Margulisiibacteriota bacterium]
MNVYIQLIQKYISPTRVAHSERVLKAALMLSNLHNANNEIVKKAALLHDIAKNQTPQSLEKLGITNGLYKEEYEHYPAVWHAFVAQTLIEYELPGESASIKDAIQFHTTGKDNMSL